MASGESKKREQDVGGTDDSSRGSREVWAVADAAQIAVGFIGILLVLVYPLGLVTFLVQLGQAHEFDYGTALYVTSLIPTSTTAARVLPILGWSLFAGILAISISILHTQRLKDRIFTIALLPSVYVGLIVLAWSRGGPNRFEVVLYLGFVVFTAGAGFAFYKLRRRLGNSRSSGDARYRLNGGLITIGAIGSLFILIAAACMTATVYTYLPFMRLCLKEEESARIVTMLSVSNETWYVIEEGPTFGTLISYPADEVKSAESIPNQNFIQRPGVPIGTSLSCVR